MMVGTQQKEIFQSESSTFEALAYVINPLTSNMHIFWKPVFFQCHYLISQRVSQLFETPT